MNTLHDITAACGNTPMIHLRNTSLECSARILVKVESFNPMSSVKDRIGLAMIEDALDDGRINTDTVIVEPTSGNTGIALAFVSRVKGLKLILTMPETMSRERRKLLRRLGAELVLTPGSEGMKGAVAKAYRILEKTPGSFMPDQFSNPSNPEIHRRTTAEEIWKATSGVIDIFVSGVGTGGTITGVSEVIKSRNPDMKSIAVEPYESPVLSGGKPGPHKIQGIGAGFVPDVLNVDVIDEIIQVNSDQALEGAAELALREGLMCGISSGAAYHAVRQIASRSGNKGKTIVAVLPDTAERYISTDLFNC